LGLVPLPGLLATDREKDDDGGEDQDAAIAAQELCRAFGAQIVGNLVENINQWGSVLLKCGGA